MDFKDLRAVVTEHLSEPTVSTLQTSAWLYEEWCAMAEVSVADALAYEAQRSLRATS